MRVYIAHSGEQLDYSPGAIIQQQQLQQRHGQLAESLKGTIYWLKQWIAAVGNISLQNQILLNSRGIKLEDGQLLSEQENENIFVFDRATFTQSDNSYGAFEPIRSLVALQELHTSQIPIPQILLPQNNGDSNGGVDPLFAESTRNIYILMKKAEHILSSGKLKFEAINRLCQEQKNQSKAIECSYANLAGHSTNILSSFKSFLTRFRRNEERFNLLLSSFEEDMKILGQTELHPKLRSGSRQTLLDCVPEKQLRHWAPKCQRELELFKEKLQQGIDLAESIRKSVDAEEYTNSVVNFHQLSEYVKQAAVTVQKEQQIVDLISNDYNILADMIAKRKQLNHSSLPTMVKNHENNVQQMRNYDHDLETILNSCITSKSNLTNEMYDRLKNISFIQYNIKRLSGKLSAYVPILRNILSKFAHLFRQQQTLTNGDATVFQFFHLFHQRGRRQHNTVTDDAGYILAENT